MPVLGLRILTGASHPLWQVSSHIFWTAHAIRTLRSHRHSTEFYLTVQSRSVMAALVDRWKLLRQYEFQAIQLAKTFWHIVKLVTAIQSEPQSSCPGTDTAC